MADHFFEAMYKKLVKTRARIFSERVKALREASGEGIVKNARSMGVTKQAISKWENMNELFLPNAESIIRVCSKYNCDPNYLLGYSDEKISGAEELKKETCLTDECILRLKDLYSDNEAYRYQDKNSKITREEFCMEFINYFILNFRKFVEPMYSSFADAVTRKELEQDPYCEEIKIALKNVEKTSREFTIKGEKIICESAEEYFYFQLLILLEGKGLKNYQDIAEEKMEKYLYAFINKNQEMRDFLITNNILELVREFLRMIEEKL